MSHAGVTFAPRQRVGNYELLVELASGGTATVGIAVYRGAAGFERLVVIKRVHRRLTLDREFTAMLLDEARLASSVRHPNVVAVTDVVRADDEVILVMDYFESVSLAQLAGAGAARIDPAVVSRVVIDVLLGLHEAHDAVDIRRQPLGIVHRDVSPENVIVGTDGISRVIDFGIAKARSRIAQTRAGIIKGKCAYMSPEQVDGQPVDRRCDVFAAGIVLWEMLTGRRLFRGEDEFDEMKRVMSAPIPAPSSVAPGLGPDVDSVVSAALARPLDERFQTAMAFARALERALPPAAPPAVAEQVAARCGSTLAQRHDRLVAILGDELDKLSPRGSGNATLPVTAAPQAPAFGAAGATQRIAPQPPAVPPAMLAADTLRSSDGEAAHDRASEPAGLPRQRPALLTLAVVTLVSLLAGAAIALLVVSRTRRDTQEPRPPAPAASASPSVSSSPSSVASATAPESASPPPSGAPSAPAPARAAPTRPRTPPELKKNPYGP
jgi:serine/threonine-protein kinase